MPALVSLTDHDDIRAATLLRLMGRYRHSPISVEWSVPYEQSTFHIGVHNLPPCSAESTFAELRDYTLRPKPAVLAELLQRLSRSHEVLLILNHPYWEETGCDAAAHAECLRKLLARHGRYLHALELNGLRPWRENRKVLELASALNLPVISGGDRHGLEPSAALNVSRAATFTEFVHEIRCERTSHIILMPHYRAPQPVRMLRMIVDALADYPHIPGHATWRDRVFVTDTRTGSPVPLASLPNGAAVAAPLSFLVEAVRLCWRINGHRVLSGKYDVTKFEFQDMEL